MRGTIRSGFAALTCLSVLLVGACGDDGGDPDDGGSGSDEPSIDEQLRLNDVQVLGSHNSYHVIQPPEVMELLRLFSPELADSLEYSHLPLPEQFTDQGIRQIELDVFADREGGLYADPAGPRLAQIPFEADPAMLEPGFKVLHVQDIDHLSTCPTFVACLEEVRDWSEDNPDHLPIMILVEVKQDTIPDPVDAGFVIPETIGAADLDALDDEIRSVFDEDHVITPDEVRGERDTLEEAVLSDGWPTLAESRGRVMFGLDNGGDLLDLYVEGHPSLEGRMMFTSSERGTPEAAFLKLNDPVADAEAIRSAVEAGYVVRTRADADTAQARDGDDSMLDAALVSGAQWLSTDYPVDDPRFPAEYVAEMPGGGTMRCNPVRRAAGCTDEVLEP
jgi:hypothetical protein